MEESFGEHDGIFKGWSWDNRMVPQDNQCEHHRNISLGWSWRIMGKSNGKTIGHFSEKLENHQPKLEFMADVNDPKWKFVLLMLFFFLRYTLMVDFSSSKMFDFRRVGFLVNNQYLGFKVGRSNKNIIVEFLVVQRQVAVSSDGNKQNQ